jgi:hypothetical protein
MLVLYPANPKLFKKLDQNCYTYQTPSTKNLVNSRNKLCGLKQQQQQPKRCYQPHQINETQLKQQPKRFHHWYQHTFFLFFLFTLLL